jgi:hypothetical protein
MQRRLVVVAAVVLAVLGALAFAVRDSHSPTRGTFGPRSTTTVPATVPAPTGRVVLCTDTSTEPECQEHAVAVPELDSNVEHAQWCATLATAPNGPACLTAVTRR